jgi:hypothetical protein
VARIENNRRTYKVLVRKPEGKRTLGNFSLDGRTILKWIFKNLNGRGHGLNWTGSEQVQILGCCEWKGAWTGLVWLRTDTDIGLL